MDDLNERAIAKTDPELFTYIKVHVDKNHEPGYGGTMEPFTIEMESLSARRESREEADARDIYKRIYKGSMPAIVSGTNSNSQIFYSSYLSTYIERDVRELSDAIDSLKFLRFILEDEFSGEEDSQRSVLSDVITSAIITVMSENMDIRGILGGFYGTGAVNSRD